ncbi:MAG TPA: site-2 protease family protein [Bryobacteraceae bacterium]|jgi:Zn-dependent protease|nr:site-2 protease family protein [Bryobacteraceae bacterium]
MRSQISLGSVFGIKIGLHYSWFLIAILIVFSLTGQFHENNRLWSDGVVLAMALATAVLFFVSLLLHELAHSTVARANGLPVKEITLFALGGISQIEKDPTSAKIEFWMAFVGPLTSAVIGGALLGLAHLIGNPSASPWTTMLLWLGYINVSLAGFNLLPGYPLDGGRVLRALIWWKTGNADRSTQLAAKVGQVVAFLFIAVGIYQFFGGAGFGGLWIAFIGWFLLTAARESYVRVGVTHALNGVRVSDVMTRDCPTVEGWMNIQDFVDQKLLHTAQRCFVVVDKGEIAGLVTPHEIKEVSRAQWPFKTMHDIMRPLEDMRSVTPDTPLKNALESMSRYDLNQLPVISHSHLEGVLSRGQILSYLQTHAELHG